MGPLKIKAVVPKDHRVEIALPFSVPEGPVELEVTVTQVAGNGPDRQYDWGPALERLRQLRDSLEGLDLKMSDEVIKLRHEEG